MTHQTKIGLGVLGVLLMFVGVIVYGRLVESDGMVAPPPNLSIESPAVESSSEMGATSSARHEPTIVKDTNEGLPGAILGSPFGVDAEAPLMPPPRFESDDLLQPEYQSRREEPRWPIPSPLDRSPILNNLQR